jgi:hypothetical protein
MKRLTLRRNRSDEAMKHLMMLNDASLARPFHKMHQSYFFATNLLPLLCSPQPLYSLAEVGIANFF